MGNDLDHSQKEVRDDLHAWAEWIVKEVGVSGFRLDAVKHMSQSFLKEWIECLDTKFPKHLFFVGEYWRGDLDVLGPVIEKFNGRLHLFDVALAGNMSKISHDPVAADLRKVFEGTLTKHYPEQAVVGPTLAQVHPRKPTFARMSFTNTPSAFRMAAALANPTFNLHSRDATRSPITSAKPLLSSPP